MFLFADLSVEEYVSQMTTATIIAAILGVIGVGLLIFAFIRKHQKTLAQSAATDTVEPEEEKTQTEQQPQKKSFQFKDWTDNAQTEEIPDAQDAQTVDQPDEEQSLATESAATEETTESVEEETPAEESETLPVEEEPSPELDATEETSVEEDVTPQEEPTEELPEEPAEDITAEETTENIAEEIVVQPQVAPEQPQQPADTADFVFGNSKRKSIPFETKVAEGNEMTIEAYETISKYLLSLPNVKQAKAFACERYYIGRKSVAKLTIRGKTINCYLAVDPATLDAKYHAQDASGSQKYEKTPAMIKARSPRAIKYCCTLAKDIVDEINNGNN